MPIFYQSVLRSKLITVQREKPIETVRDILDRGENLYVPIYLPVEELL